MTLLTVALGVMMVALGVMMVALDGTIVAVANPAIQSHLHASLAGIQRVTNAYLLAPPCGPLTGSSPRIRQPGGDPPGKVMKNHLR